MLKEFREFLQNYGVIGLAIAVIIGGKLNALVGSLVNDLITPLLLAPVLNSAGISNINGLQWNGVFYGRVLSAVIEFLVVAFLVFLFAKKVMKEEVVAKK